MLRNIQKVKSGLTLGKLQCSTHRLRTPNRRLLGASAVSCSSSLAPVAPLVSSRCPPPGLHFSRHGCPSTAAVWRRGTISSFVRPARNLHTASVLRGDQFIDVITPPFAESITQGEVRWEKELNDAVETDETLGEIETDKTAIPIPSPASGVIVELYAEDGAVVEAGTKLCKLAVGDVPPSEEKQASTSTSEETSPLPVETVSPVIEQTPEPATPTVPIDGPIPSTTPPIPPLPSQPLGHIPPPPPPPRLPPVAAPSSSKAILTGVRTEKRVKLSRMRQRIAERLKEAQNVNAMLTTFNEIDMSNVIALRSRYKEEFLKKHGVKLGFMSAFVRAAVHALQDQPVVNAVIEGKEIVYRDYIDISVAVATPKGLVVPVLRNVETMNFADIELAINELGVKAQDGTLAVEDMDGGTFTISNGGVFGSLYGTPIINPPQSAILGMHATKDRPVAINGKVEIRPMMYVALTYDHRLIDGREAVLFLKKIKSAVEDPQVVLLDI